MFATMVSSPFQELICFDEYSATPKYRQLMNSILKAIERGKLVKNDPLPSINELSYEYDICRHTAEKGYLGLKSQGIIGSIPGKGYFVKSVDVDRTKKIFLMFNKLSQHKKVLYDSLVSTLGEKAVVDFYIYNNDLSLFRRLLDNSRNDYHHYVILPHFIEGGETAHHYINAIAKEKLILLDKVIPGVTGEFGAVYENFEEDILSSLQKALPQLGKYHTLKIIFPENSYYPQEIVNGFISFCRDYAFQYKVIHDINQEKINAGEVYINLMDDDLTLLVERVVESKLVVGKEVGIISYNETPIKKIILNGITTISTDFEAMGVETANMILSATQKQIHVPFSLILRPSL